MKKILSVVLILLFVAQIFSGTVFAANESGSPKHIPRIVSVVFDDSGSMYKDTDRWAYASYAMQAFVAMMGEEDVLYVTYLNAPTGTVKINLSNSAKQGNIDNIEKTMFGGGTPNKLQNGAECLKEEYSNYGNNAKYYLVVLADGELTDSPIDMSEALETVSSSTVDALSGADFETVYFAMYNDENKNNIIFENIPGVTGHSAKDGNEIVNALRDISADIMGRTKIDHSVSGGKLSFELEYPALSVAIFVQKENAEFSNVRVPITKNGAGVSYDTGVYYVDCPTEIVKNTSTTVYNEKIPTNPPSGFVTLIENGNSSIAKGSYSIDFSAYGISTKDLVVLVEPAVKIGCKYFIGDSTNAMTFEELKKYVREGDEVTVECGLYEMNSDGSIGDPIPLDVLSPNYNIYLDNATVGKNVGGNRYELEIAKDFENKELKIEATLKGYQPFVLRETFGELNTRPAIDNSNGADAKGIDVIKPEFQGWIDGSKDIRFTLLEANSAMLADLAIRVDGYNGIPSGVCSSLGDNIRIEGKDIVYIPKFSADTDYSQLPQNIKITLLDNTDNSELAAVNLNVKQPKYRFEITNELENIPLSLGMLKGNTKKVSFSLYACYDGSESYSPISNYNCEKEIKFSLNSGILTGNLNEQNGLVEFTPVYDSDVNTDVSPADIVGGDHSVFATATVDGITVESEKITLSVAGGSYKITVENLITEAFTLDSIKQNDKKIVFSLLADYNGDGNYGAIEDWDLSAYEKLVIDSGELPGKFETVYDAGGKPIGKSFTPLYDENNNNGIVFTKVAGKVHTVKATLEGQGSSAETTVEVLPPKYDLTVRNDGITLVDVELRGNEQYVGFTVSRDGRVLTSEELNALAPFDVRFSKEQKWMAMDVSVCEGEDGSAYISCKPKYDGWTFISSGLWNWLCLFKVEKGNMSIDITVGLDSASAAVDVGTSELAWTIFFVTIAGLAIILWIIFCCLTRVRFIKGSFYKIGFKPDPNGIGYIVSDRTALKANKKSLVRFLLSGKFMIPFSEQSVSITVGKQQAKFVAKKSPFKRFSCKSYPYSKSENRTKFNRGHIVNAKLTAIINRENGVSIDSTTLVGKDCGEQDIKMEKGNFLVEHGKNKVILFVTKKEEKAMREKKKRGRKKETPAKTAIAKKGLKAKKK